MFINIGNNLEKKNEVIWQNPQIRNLIDNLFKRLYEQNNEILYLKVIIQIPVQRACINISKYKTKKIHERKMSIS